MSYYGILVLAYNGPIYVIILRDAQNCRRIAADWTSIRQTLEFQAPNNTGSDFFNYKGDFSIVLLALVDANYKFTYVDVGCKGRMSDGVVFKNTANLQQGQLILPQPTALLGRNTQIPYVIVADDAFALDTNLMKPYPGQHDKSSKERIFNYRLSRARCIVENVFGILSAVFCVLGKPILLAPEKTQLITLTCCYLHNFLMK
ncbi:unnamed protein product [Acanthoscelides obtectus]|uniref:DDE Tnp4 domain-containing protein n=1 Tax=Acanthoscelides obtectus TaxID=200917 RepID=A0A9P0KA03_ACAOB|nr:unnamed protein product [Acanthoscelides obtectus]CAK1668888.1 Protein ALP1-like [Acanthoscelides obtectus]